MLINKNTAELMLYLYVVESGEFLEKKRIDENILDWRLMRFIKLLATLIDSENRCRTTCGVAVSA